MPRVHFNDRWKIWIWKNIDSGCTKDEIFRILLEHGFRYDIIRRELNHELSIPCSVTGPPYWSSIECDRASSFERIYLPGAERQPTTLGELYTIEGFLDGNECDDLIRLAESNLFPSTITSKDEPDRYFRTSRTCRLGLNNHPLVRQVDRRICAMMGFNPDFSEPLQAQCYRPGEEFKAHTDAFMPDSREFDDFGGDQGQRTWTFMVYLNDVAKGGETEFPALGSTLTPKKGLAVAWNNLDHHGQPNPHTLHRSHPVIEGRKLVLTKWFRKRARHRMHVKEPREFLPGFTQRGFDLARIPEELLGMIRELAEDHPVNAPTLSSRNVDGSGIHGVPRDTRGFSQDFLNRLSGVLTPVVESWSGTELVMTDIEPVECHQTGSRIPPRTNRIWNQLLSVMLVIDQELDSPWPFEIEDHHYRCHHVFPGENEMILFEGARLRHGRPTPLDGTRCRSMTIHYRPRMFNS